MDFFTADPHFGSSRHLEYSRRPFSTVTEMDDYLIEQWNNKVTSNDTIWILGDFGSYSKLAFLNGHLKLLMGNYEYHDLHRKFNNIDEFKRMLTSFNSKVELITENKVITIEEATGVSRYWICHKPEDRKNNEFNLFGHIHGLQKVKKNGLNVGIDCHHFAPIDIYTIKFYEYAITHGFYDHNVFMT